MRQETLPFCVRLPFKVLVSDFMPTPSADWQLSIFVLYIQLDIRALTLAIPRVSAVFNRASQRHSFDQS
jgi:hypothetical protein